MTTSTRWHGTRPELFAFWKAVSGNCACVSAADGTRVSICTLHGSLLGDQATLDRLVFARRIAERLKAEEFATVVSAASQV